MIVTRAKAGKEERNVRHRPSPKSEPEIHSSDLAGILSRALCDRHRFLVLSNQKSRGPNCEFSAQIAQAAVFPFALFIKELLLKDVRRHTSGCPQSAGSAHGGAIESVGRPANETDLVILDRKSVV